MTDQKTPRPTPKLVPNHPVTKPVEQAKVKTPYVRKPHLDQRPFQGNEALQKLRNDLNKSKRPRSH